MLLFLIMFSHLQVEKKNRALGLKKKKKKLPLDKKRQFVRIPDVGPGSSPADGGSISSPLVSSDPLASWSQHCPRHTTSSISLD